MVRSLIEMARLEKWHWQRLVIVGGCGRAGLPPELVFAERGIQVALLDTDAGKVLAVNTARMPFREQGAAGRGCPDSLGRRRRPPVRMPAPGALQR